MRDQIVASIDRHLSEEDRADRLDALIEKRAVELLSSIDGIQETLSHGWETECGETAFSATLAGLVLARRNNDLEAQLAMADALFWWLEATAQSCVKEALEDE